MSSGDFMELEELDGVRMAWNVWPYSRLEATKCVVPFGVLYSPAKQTSQLQVVEYDPVPCKQCGAVLNPYAQADYHAKMWACPLCHARNHFPPHYQGVSEAAVPAELWPQSSTIEYALPSRAPVSPPAYVFVIDTAVPEDELAAAKTAVAQALTMVPDYCLVGLVTFGTHVHVHELGFAECPKAYVFRGSKDYAPAAVQEQLGLGGGAAAGGPRGRGPVPPPGGAPPAPGRGNRFILPLAEVEFTLTAALEDLQRDAFPAAPGHRPARCTGTALQVAAALMGGCLPAGAGAARALLLTGGPCTEGGGRVVDKELGEPIRSHKDLAKDAAPHYRRAKKYYDAVAAQFVAHGHSLDVYACSLDQVRARADAAPGALWRAAPCLRSGAASHTLASAHRPPPAPPPRRRCAGWAGGDEDGGGGHGRAVGADRHLHQPRVQGLPAPHVHPRRRRGRPWAALQRHARGALLA
jgi:protein transport protein SEC23